MHEFLIILAVIWTAIASYSDLKKREIPNWLSFSFVAFALAYRAMYSAFNYDLMFFVFGLLGFMVFFGLAYLFYYGRLFAGGDAKLLFGFGAVLPAGYSIYSNLLMMWLFIFLLLLAGGLYGLIYSSVLAVMNRKKFIKEFAVQLQLRKKLSIVSAITAFFALIMVLLLSYPILIVIPAVILVFPILFAYGKAVEESCMIASVDGKKVTVGDWLYEAVTIKGRKIKPHWEGLDEKQVELIRKSGKKVRIKQGVPFVPSFLIAFILLLILKNNIINYFSAL